MRHHIGGCRAAAGASGQDPDEDAEDVERSLGQDLRHALGLGLEEPGVGLAGREADSVGQLLHQQGSRHTSP